MARFWCCEKLAGNSSGTQRKGNVHDWQPLQRNSLIRLWLTSQPSVSRLSNKRGNNHMVLPGLIQDWWNKLLVFTCLCLICVCDYVLKISTSPPPSLEMNYLKRITVLWDSFGDGVVLHTVQEWHPLGHIAGFLVSLYYVIPMSLN
jgi:hypothetical protein